MQWDVLINPVVGGLIGYGTNYLAIKMLFRPHEAKYIGKYKIPFTPGLIPKEKDMLAHEMGQVTEEYLLTEDMLVDTLTNDKAREIFAELVSEIPRHMEGSKKTIGQLSQDLIGHNMDERLDKIMDQLVMEIITMLRSRELIEKASPYIANKIEKSLNIYLSRGLEDESISNYIQEFARELLGSKESKDYLYKTFGDLEEVMYAKIEDNAASIGRSIIAAISSGQEATRIKDTIRRWTEENFNQMVTMFLNIDKIYDGIINYANQALEDPSRSYKFGDLLSSAMRDLVVNNPDYKDKAIDVIKDQINDESTDKLIALAKEKLQTNQINIHAKIEKLIEDEWDKYINTQEFIGLIRGVLEEVKLFIANIPITNLTMALPKESQKHITSKIFNLYIEVVKNNSKQVVKLMDISRLVENKINEYSSQEAEEVILSVVRDQLRGITLIGALLGTAIGVLSNLIG